MRLTFRVTTSGDCWSVAIPRVGLEGCYPKDAHGVEQFDEAAFRRAVAGNERVMMSSDDRGPVCAFAAMLLASLGNWLDDNDKNDGSAQMKRAAATMKRRGGVRLEVRLRHRAVRRGTAVGARICGG